jgi:hypothetical protein
MLFYGSSKKIENKQPMPNESIRLLRYVLTVQRGFTLSLESICEHLEEIYSQIMAAHISEEQMQRGQELLRQGEERRQANMRRFAEEKLLAISSTHF